MSTHPVEPEDADAAGAQPDASNPTRLPIEPEFGPVMPTTEPEDPGPAEPMKP